ncbi:MAG: hypothetical protein EOO75_07410 [Myxococcales bacterium]|nr:MAG: hypothetical protein EOO75_07410 [Myxococcales bacterium]
MGNEVSGVGGPGRRVAAGPAEETYNQALEKGMERVVGEKIPVQGPTPGEASVSRGKASLGRMAWEGFKTAGPTAGHLLSHSRLHGIAHSAAGGLLGAARVAGAVGLGALANAYTAYELSHLVTGDASRSEFTKAQLREHYGQATALLAGNALPKAYVDSRTSGEPFAAHTLDAARESLRNRTGSEEKAEATMRRFQAQAEQGATAGMEHAAAHELRSPAQRDALLAQDRSFRERFASDLAFREGVNAMVWLGEKQPAEFESRRSLFAGQSAARAGQVR